MDTTPQELPPPVIQALKHPKTLELFNTVQLATPVTFRPSPDDSWSSHTSKQQTTIEYADCKHPAEALAHELLHAQMKIRGYRQYRYAVAKAPCPERGLLPEVLGILDNELPHHKMAAEFSMMGLDPRRFYCDGDVNAIKKVRRAIEKVKRTDHVAVFFSQFVTLIAPAGAAPEVERKQALAYFQTRCSSETWAKLQEIERQVAAWRQNPSLDARPYIERVLNLLDVNCDFWVGVSNNFPDDGFFVGEPFGLDEAAGA